MGLNKLLLFVILVGICSAQICPNQLSDAVNVLLQNCSNCQRSYWGISIEQLYPNGTTNQLVGINDDKFFTPASNNKLLTTSVAFFELGVNFTISTPIYLSSSGDICVAGKGDPSITMHEINSLAQKLSANGITKVNNVVVDNSFYDGSALPQNWEWSDITQYWGAQPTPLIVDENTITIQVLPGLQVGDLVTANFSYSSDSSWMTLVVTAVTSEANTTANLQVDIEPKDALTIYVSGTFPLSSSISNIILASMAPSIRFGHLFSSSLIANSIPVYGQVLLYPCEQEMINNNGQKIETLVSPSIVSMLNWTLLTSDNLYAETFLRQLGKTSSPSPTQTTSQLGIEVVKNALTQKVGIQSDAFKQDDGSGLSRHNLVTPSTLTSLISYIYFLEDGQLYLSFLPTAGESGTLSDRFINTSAQGVLHAKTGTMGGVNSLSGFVDHGDSSHPVLIFSIIVNSAPFSELPPIDDIGVLLSQVVNC